MTARRRVLLGLALGLPLSALFAWLAVRNASLGDVWDALAGARPGLVAAAVACMAGVYAAQAVRWREVAAARHVRRLRFAELVVAGVACNNVLPARLGDLFRARWLARDAGMPGGRALGTVVVDRAFDLAALVAMLLVSLPFAGDAAWLRRIALGGLVALAALGVSLGFARVYTRARQRRRLARRGRLRRIARDLLEGLADLPRGRRLAGVAALSAAAWATWALAAWLVARAVGIELGAAEAAFTGAVVNLGVAIPSSPGFIGTYQWLGVSALGLLDVATDEALAFAVLVHAVWYVPTTLAGGGLLFARAVRLPGPADEARQPSAAP